MVYINLYYKRKISSINLNINKNNNLKGLRIIFFNQIYRKINEKMR